MENRTIRNNEVSDHIGNVYQIGGTQRLIVDEGKGKGTAIIRVRNGNGLDFSVVPDKGMDIFDLQLDGVQLAWISRNGLVSNSNFDAEGMGWLRSFGGGLLTTCGLRNVGPPEDDGGEHFGLHGRISGIPARNVNTSEHWKNGILTIEVSGEMSETNVFGEYLVIRRTYRVTSASNTIELHDQITNHGSTVQQIMLLYHMNWGFPLLSPGTGLKLNPARVEIRGDDQTELDQWGVFLKPTQNYTERVYFFDLLPDKSGQVNYQLENTELKKGVRVSWNKDQLPALTEWKMMGKGDYVLGLEPGNTYPIGRKGTRGRGMGEFINSSETREVLLIMEFLNL